MEIKIKDKSGREITLRKPNVLAQLDLVDAIGESSSNRLYLAMVLPLIYVAAIDGIEVPPFETKREVKALWSRLGDEGLKSVNEGIEEHFTPDQKDEVESAKKSQGTQDSDKS